MKHLYDWETNNLVWKFETDEEGVKLITRFLVEHCQGEDWISDLEIEMNYNEFDTLEKLCNHYNFYVEELLSD